MKMAGMKEAVWRLQAAAYASRLTLQTRYGDMDTNAHLNNTAIARLFEEVRVRSLSALHARTRGAEHGHRRAAQVMIAHLSIDYLAEGEYPEPVEGAFAILGVGRSSYRLAMGLFQHGKAFALAESVMVNLGEDRRPDAIPDALRTELESLRRP